jgi:hypothetical protein
MRTFAEIWRELPEDERLKASDAFWNGVKRGDSGWQFGVDYLADKLRSRPVFIAKSLSHEKRVRHVALLPNPPDILIAAALQHLQLHRRPHMLRRFLDCLSLPHNNGRFESKDVYKGPAPDRERLTKAVERIFSEFDAVEVRLYLDCLEAESQAFWKDLPGVRVEVEARRAKGGATEPIPAPAASEAPPDAEPPPSQGGRDPFTNLDHVVTDAIVASVAGGVGSLQEDQVQDLVEEFVALNPKRHQSYFHRGFLDVLAGREPAFDWPEANAERRAWYLCGALAGYARRKDSGAIVRLAEVRTGEARALGAGEGLVGPAAAVAAPILFDAFLEAKGPPAAADVIQPPAVAQAGPGFFLRVLEAASSLLRELRGDEAGLLLDLLQGAVGVFEAFGTPPPPAVLKELRRRQAHRARLLGDHEKARALLESLLREGPGDREAMIRADLGLIACGFRSLTEVRLPEVARDLGETARTMAQGEERFRESAAQAGPGGHGEYCLGTLLVARGDLAGALPVLSRAVSQMERRPETYEPIRVLSRARLYQARCLAATLDPGHMNHAAEKLVIGARAVGRECPYLVREALYGIAMCDSEAATRAALALEEDLGDVILDAAGEAELLPRLPSLQAALVRRAEDEARSPSERFGDFVTLLRVGKQTRDMDLARRALDGLEALAQAGAQRTRLLKELENEEFYRPAWDPDDAALFRSRALEAEGRLDEAAAVLTVLAHGVLARGGHEADQEARGILDRIRGFGAVEPDSVLVRRLEAAPAEAVSMASVASTVVGRVLFVGGNETQERYREDVTAWVKERWPNVGLTFEFPGWGSNWGRELPRVENLVKKADAVVLMRFVRTLFGMHVRRMCSQANIPWVACTGHGRDSMRGSIAAAIARLGTAGRTARP